MKSKTKKHKQRERATIAISQIIILVVATIAFSWMIGSSVGVVGASDPGESCKICIGDRLYSGTIDTSGNCQGNSILENCDYGCNSDTDNCNEPPLGSEKNPISLEEVIIIGGAIDKYAPKVVSSIKNVLNKGTGKEITKTVLSDAGNPNALRSANIEVAKDPSKLWNYFRFGRSQTASIFPQIVSNFVYAAITAVAIIVLAEKLGASERNMASLTSTTLIGTGTGMATATIWAFLAKSTSLLGTGFLAAGPPGWFAAAVTVLFAGIHMLTGYQLYSQEVFTYRVGLWQPQTGGSDCNKCNLLEVGTGENKVSACSKYICHSYGTACEWVNDETQYETCIEVNKGDISAPVITPVKEIYGENVFSGSKYDYKISAAGAKIIYTGEGAGTQQCIPVFTPIKLAFKTNENAQCKISLEPIEGTTDEETFSNMKNLAEGTAYVLNHTLQLSSIVSASSASLENAGYELTNGGNFKFYIRCKDVQGNINTQNYMISFCVQTVDTRAPEIKGTNPPENSYIPHGTTLIENFQVYTDEPADCRWDTKEVKYPYMGHEFDWCSQTLNEPLVGFDFGCQTNLTGFKDGAENKYYIACADQPGEEKRNVMQPYEVILKGTDKLRIQSARINGRANGTTIRDSEPNIDVNIEVKTIEGAEDGLARCLYSEDLTEPRTYFLFDNEGSKEYLSTNTLNLYMSEGNYTYFIKCYDVAENTAETMINFSVETDISSPTIVRVYKEDEYLKLITDEVSACVYSTLGCNYYIEDGREIDSSDGKEHYVEWDPEIDLYIKCIDEFDNYPDEGECSIALRAFEIAEII